MPRLKFVNLSFNSLSKPIEVSLDKRWEELRNLVLNSTYVNWESVQKILDHLPSLEELHLSLNDYNNVDLHKKRTDCDCTENKNENCCCHTNTIEKKHSVIRILHFTGNPIKDWREISKLGEYIAASRLICLVQLFFLFALIAGFDENNKSDHRFYKCF